MHRIIRKPSAAVKISKEYLVKAKDIVERCGKNAQIAGLYLLIVSCNFSKAQNYIRENRMNQENVSIAASKAWQESMISGYFSEADRIGDHFGSPAKIKRLADPKE
ncbi:MAG: hypothetical protein NTY68_01930 [Candidatus Micrarchaeota archaeon]|nr:hypothetical protein [Candidatus Micrarchaeota archaeon]